MAFRRVLLATVSRRSALTTLPDGVAALGAALSGEHAGPKERGGVIRPTSRADEVSSRTVIRTRTVALQHRLQTLFWCSGLVTFPADRVAALGAVLSGEHAGPER